MSTAEDRFAASTEAAYDTYEHAQAEARAAAAEQAATDADPDE